MGILFYRTTLVFAFTGLAFLFSNFFEIDRPLDIRANLPLEYTSFQEIEKELECLALNIYFEAKGESFDGKLAVAQVTLNRKLHVDWPSNICDVVYQRTFRGRKVTCQFSWYCDGKSDTVVNQEQYYYSMVAAREVLLDGYRNPDLEHAYFYHAYYVAPGWRMQVLARIGAHIFYGYS